MVAVILRAALWASQPIWLNWGFAMYETIAVAQYLLINMLPGLFLLIPLYFVVKRAAYSGVKRALEDDGHSSEEED